MIGGWIEGSEDTRLITNALTRSTIGAVAHVCMYMFNMLGAYGSVCICARNGVPTISQKQNSLGIFVQWFDIEILRFLCQYLTLLNTLLFSVHVD